MEISEVRVKLVANPHERLRAYCSVTFSSDFVIRDLKVIEGVNGIFVAMPSRKLTDRCPRCSYKNHLRARYCNECGLYLRENRASRDEQGRSKLHADIAHPINTACREQIQAAVIEAYEAEVERSKSPDYQPQTFDDFDEYDDYHEGETIRVAPATGIAPPTRMASPTGITEAEDEREDDEREVTADSSSQTFSEYNSLIADLKRDAANRRQNVTASSA
ncbi:MAG: SpoVG family protein, partial [Phycisphaerae bacterium]|nr:SpoVG family protein [Phycisphaerae bacterium]